MQPELVQPKRCAYSYLRFSSPDQMAGDSIRRQTSLAAAYATEFGLTLDDQLTYKDFGISSFRGQNATSGRLGDFLTAVSNGIVPPGSVLLVENLDRLSRESALNAQNLLTQIVLAGVAIVTLSDQRTYSIDELRRDPMGLIFALINFIRANEESELKSFRGKASWSAKRAVAASVPITASCPRWLALDKVTNRFVIIRKRVRIIRKIFAMMEQGESLAGIARTLNRRKTPTWQEGALWTSEKVGRITKSSTVIGTFVPHVIDWEDGTRIRRPCEPVRNYYPAIISIDLFDRVQAQCTAGYRTGHGSVVSIVHQLAVCGECGNPMVIIRTGHNTPSIVCAGAANGTACRYQPIPYSPIETALRKGLPAILRDWNLADAGFGRTTRLLIAQNVVDRARRDGTALNRATLIEGDPDDAWEKLALAEEALQEAVESYQQRTTRRLTRQITSAIECLAEPEWRRKEAMHVNRTLRTILAKAVIDTSNGAVHLHRRDGSIDRVAFA